MDGVEAVFLNAIRNDADDDTVRLVYADWLEERDDPRHELIRVEIRMRRLPVHSEEYWRLKPERARLRSGASDEWLTAMGYVPSHRPMFTSLPPTTAERWRLAEEFIEVWHQPPVQPGHGYTPAELDAAEDRLGRRLPRAVREWYAFSARREDVWSRQDRFRSLEGLGYDEDGNLEIRNENQGCTRWYIRADDLEQDDPPVFGGDENREVSPTFSAFALFVLVYEIKFTAIWGALDGSSGAEQEQFITELGRFPKVVPCDLPQWYWFDEPKYFWEADDVIFEEDPHGWYWIAARTADARCRVTAHFSSQLTWYD